MNETHQNAEKGIAAWLEQAFSREHTGSYDDCKLGPVTTVLTHLGLDRLRPVTIAGTKGKGSTQAFLEAILLAHGRRTIAFTSPHVFHLTERWRIDGRPADPVAIERLCETIADAEQATREPLTYFERCFVIACLLAREIPEAVFLCEVGLGGRLDCANALDTSLAILTHLSLDHVNVLGDTLEAIAGEKLAIARPDAPLLIAPQSPAATTAITSRLPDAKVGVDKSAPDIGWIQRPDDADRWNLGLGGTHQADNAATALTAATLLLDDCDQAKARRSLAHVHLPARCQRIDLGGRQLLIDGAHNGPSIAATLATADAQLAGDYILIIGLATDKELDPILAELPAADREIHRCGYAGPRARTITQWAPAPPHWPFHKTIKQALRVLPTDRDLCITGSFYLAGEALVAVGRH